MILSRTLPVLGVWCIETSIAQRALWVLATRNPWSYPATRSASLAQSASKGPIGESRSRRSRLPYKREYPQRSNSKKVFMIPCLAFVTFLVRGSRHFSLLSRVRPLLGVSNTSDPVLISRNPSKLPCTRGVRRLFSRPFSGTYVRRAGGITSSEMSRGRGSIRCGGGRECLPTKGSSFPLKLYYSSRLWLRESLVGSRLLFCYDDGLHRR